MENNRVVIQNILNDYEQGMPINEIKKRNNVQNALIYKVVQQYGTPETRKKHNMAKRNKLKEKKMAIDMAKVIENLKNGVEMQEISKEYDIHYNALKSKIDQYVEENNIDIQEIITPNNERYFRKEKVEIPISEIVKAVEERRLLKQIANKYEVSATTVYEQKKNYEQVHGKIECKVKPVVKVNGVPIDPETYGRRKRKEPNDDKEKEAKRKKSTIRKQKKEIHIIGLWQEYRNGTPVGDLASRWVMNEGTLRKQLNEYRNYLLTEAYVNHNKTIGEIARESNLPIQDVKEIVRKVLRERVKEVPKGWEIIQKCRGYTEEQILKMYILEKRKKQNETGERE